MRPVFSHLCLNKKNILSHVDPINDRLLSRILADDIGVKESKGAVIRRCRQANDKGIKIGQYLTSDIVDRTVALIHDDTLKKFRRIFGVIDHFFLRLGFCCDKFSKGNLFRSFI